MQTYWPAIAERRVSPASTLAAHDQAADNNKAPPAVAVIGGDAHLFHAGTSAMLKPGHLQRAASRSPPR